MPTPLTTFLSKPVLRMGLSALVAFSLDQLSKIVMIHRLDLASVHTIEVWPPYLSFSMAWNKGVNFGFLSNYDSRWLLVAFSIAVSLGAGSLGAQPARMEAAAGDRRSRRRCARQRFGPRKLWSGCGFPQHELLRNPQSVLVQYCRCFDCVRHGLDRDRP